MKEDLVRCAQINFENFERAFPLAQKHPYYKIAKLQLDEALGGKTLEEVLGKPSEIGSVTFNDDGTQTVTGIIVETMDNK